MYVSALLAGIADAAGQYAVCAGWTARRRGTPRPSASRRSRASTSRYFCRAAAAADRQAALAIRIESPYAALNLGPRTAGAYHRRRPHGPTDPDPPSELFKLASPHTWTVIVSTNNDLAAKIRQNADGGVPVQAQLAANQRIIARVTDGIYREPWAAFRELVANAYDADATHVVVETGAPEFNQITVRDDGIGMSADTLAYIVQNIGASSKRRAKGAELNTVQAEDSERSPAGRPLIGKIGIGLFAVAQLTQHFQIITKSRNERVRISATVQLRTHNEAVAPDADDNYVAGTVDIQAETVSDDERHTHGTSVVLYSLRPEIRRTLQSMRRWEAVLFGDPGTETYQPPPTYHIGRPFIPNAEDDPHVAPKLPWEPSDPPERKFVALLNAAEDTTGRATKAADLDHFDEYLKLIWKLSLSLPLRYPDGHPFDHRDQDGLLLFTARDDARQAIPIELQGDESIGDNLGLRDPGDLDASAFAVTLDGIALGRPLRRPAKLAKISRIPAPVLLASKQANPFTPEDQDRAGGPLSFEGYLYWNSQIRPKETTGVLIRIREASGTLFDRTFLNYQVSEQTRLRQISAEIFVEEGLDGAINIDRESFNYSHPHFLFVQRWLHRSLRLLVNRLKGIAKEDLDREKAMRQIEAEETLLARANEIWRRRLGDEADPPFVHEDNQPLPTDVGGAEIRWTPGDLLHPTAELSATSVVLEAYGVLSALSTPEERAQLLRDVVTVLAPKK